MTDMMSKSGRGDTKILKTVCDHICRERYKFIQQNGWPHHFLPLCGCKENAYFSIPGYVAESQYEMYMILATGNRNPIMFLKGTRWVNND
jgi:hypothetical protein